MVPTGISLFTEKQRVVRRWKQCCDKLKVLKKTYKDILDKLLRSSAGVESEDEKENKQPLAEEQSVQLARGSQQLPTAEEVVTH